MEENKKSELENELAVSRKRLKIWIGTAAVFVFMAIVLAISVFFVLNGLKNADSSVTPENHKAAETETDKARANKIRRLVDGIYVELGKENSRPFAVMIDNHYDARPQSGLSSASIVYEAEAEGGTTRYMAVYATDDDLPEIGPVRSARPYFIDWAKEWSALYVHVGGSPAALAKISKEKIFNLNEFYQGSYFWRSSARFAPHNVYISKKNLEKYAATKDAAEPRFKSWIFKDDASEDSRGSQEEIRIGYLLKGFDVSWKYDKVKNEYARFLGGIRHADSAGGEINAKNVIIQYVASSAIDDELRLDMSHIGGGNATICLDGYCREGEWKKKDGISKTEFTYANGEEARLNAGPTWIQIVPPEYQILIR